MHRGGVVMIVFQRTNVCMAGSSSSLAVAFLSCEVPVDGTNGAERYVAAGQPFGEGDQVGHDSPMVDGEPPARAAETGHYLVADHQDSVPVAELAHALEITVRRDQDAVGPDDRFEDERRDGL